ncbi:MAG: V-type ATP synthase subunit I [Candidatus Gracilibacteria bacterium]|nr:V-type ATP synthase subunit I [Candidatus Gracilibacteria bacterium]
MPVAKIKKVQIVASAEQKGKILKALQDEGSIQIIDAQKDVKKYSSQGKSVELDYANVNFAIGLLSKYQEKKGLFGESIELTEAEVEEEAKKVNHKEIVKECMEIEDKKNNAINEISILQGMIDQYKEIEKCSFKIEDLKDTDTAIVEIGKIRSIQFEEFSEESAKISKLIELSKIDLTSQWASFVIIYYNDVRKEVEALLSKYKFMKAELPNAKGYIKDLICDWEEKKEACQKEIKKYEKNLKKIAENLRALKIVHDFLLWEIEKNQEGEKSEHTMSNFIITGWMIKKEQSKIESVLEKMTKEFIIIDIKPDDGEEVPVTINNNRYLSPFEAVTKIFGLPKSTELDPTPYLAAFFIIYFGLCLTDAGYGIVMFIATALVLKFVNLPTETRKLVKLLMYGGVVTFFIGAIFGGWFGLTADQVPESLTYLTAEGERMFLFQKVNALTDPLTVLIIAAVLGFIQVTVGTFMKFFHEFFNYDKKEALLEVAPWCYMLVTLGLFILTKAGVIPEAFGPLTKNLLSSAFGLIIGLSVIRTAYGNFKGAKTVAQKLIMSVVGMIVGMLKGFLSLYGLVGYMSDILSYSRLLALGLATAIIGLAVNIIGVLVKDMIPVIGWVLMVVIFIGGHLFNLLINSLGAYIHSGRLQFVEFFGKFMEGGGLEFRPFSKKNKYIYIKK